MAKITAHCPRCHSDSIYRHCAGTVTGCYNWTIPIKRAPAVK
ncbi:hypothetical protein QI600_004747 [Salmonella enterica]|nr:hypothetical protein [Salmonella enterica]